MKMIIPLIVLLSGIASAQDYFYVGTNAPASLPDDVAYIDWSSQDDRKAYKADGYPSIRVLPSLVDVSSRQVIPITGSVAQAKRLMDDQIRQASTNDASFPDKLLDSFTFSPETLALIGTNKTGFAQFSGKTDSLTNAQRIKRLEDAVLFIQAYIRIHGKLEKDAGGINMQRIVRDAQ